MFVEMMKIGEREKLLMSSWREHANLVLLKKFQIIYNRVTIAVIIILRNTTKVVQQRNMAIQFVKNALIFGRKVLCKLNKNFGKGKISLNHNVGVSETPLHFIFRYKGDSVGQYRGYGCVCRHTQGHPMGTGGRPQPGL